MVIRVCATWKNNRSFTWILKYGEPARHGQVTDDISRHFQALPAPAIFSFVLNPMENASAARRSNAGSQFQTPKACLTG
jgi:hypothetical protein